MSTKTTETESRKPSFVAKSRKERMGKTSYERIGVAFLNDDGSLYIKLAGTQVVSDFMLYSIETAGSQDE